jgi:hypothetical protein
LDFSGKLPVVKLGRRIFLKEDDLLDIIESGYRPVSPERDDR